MRKTAMSRHCHGKPGTARGDVPYFPIFCVTVGLCGLFSALAEGQLEPMAGTGGVIRDAERRVLSQQKPAKTAKAVPDIKGAPSSAPARKDVEDKVVGPVANVRVFGSTAFAEREASPG